MDDWFAADQDDIDLGAAMSAASQTSGGWNVGSALGAVQGVTNTVSGLVRTLYQARTDMSRAQSASAIDLQRQQGQLAAETIRARQLANAAATPSLFADPMRMLMPILVIGAGALLWQRFAK
jgi:hypothetical protein